MAGQLPVSPHTAISSPTPAVLHAAITPAVSATATTASNVVAGTAHPVASVLTRLLSLGPNTPQLPPSPLTTSLAGVFRRVETKLGLVPAAGTATVSTPDAATGEVTGNLAVTEADGLPLTYSVTTQPAKGTVTVDGAGNYTYIPSIAARLAAQDPGALTSAKTDTFIVTASDCLAATPETVTVPVSGLALGAVPPFFPVATVPVGGSPGELVTSPDGSRLYVGSWGNVAVIDTVTYTTVATIDIYGGHLWDPMVISPDGSRIYVGTGVDGGRDARDGRIRVIDTATNTEVDETIHYSDYPVDMVISPDGSRVYVLGKNGKVRAIDTETKEAINGFSYGVDGDAVHLAITPDGRYLYSPETRFGIVDVVDAATSAQVAEINVGSYPRNVVVSPDGNAVYVLNSNFDNIPYPGSGSVSVIDTATNTAVATIPVGLYPTNLVVGPDSSRLYVVNEVDSTVSVIDTTTNGVVATVPVGTYPTDLAVSPDGKYVYVTNNRANTVSVIDTTTNAVVATVPVGQNPTTVIVSPDGAMVYVTNERSDSVSVIYTGH